MRAQAVAGQQPIQQPTALPQSVAFIGIPTWYQHLIVQRHSCTQVMLNVQ